MLPCAVSHTPIPLYIYTSAQCCSASSSELSRLAIKVVYPVNTAILSYRDCAEESFVPLLKYFALLSVVQLFQSAQRLIVDQ